MGWHVLVLLRQPRKDGFGIVHLRTKIWEQLFPNRGGSSFLPCVLLKLSWVLFPNFRHVCTDPEDWRHFHVWHHHAHRARLRRLRQEEPAAGLHGQGAQRQLHQREWKWSHHTLGARILQSVKRDLFSDSTVLPRASERPVCRAKHWHQTSVLGVEIRLPPLKSPRGPTQRN